MGYYVKLTDSSAVISKANRDEVLDRWHEMNNKSYDNHKRGGSYSSSGTISKNYSWMPADYEKTTHTPEQILEHLGFEFSTNDKGDISIEGYDSKTGQEGLFFKKVGNLIEAGSLMQWHGEDGTRFAWFFDGKQMQEVDVKEGLTLVSQFKGDTQPEKSVNKEKPKKNSRYQL